MKKEIKSFRELNELADKEIRMAMEATYHRILNKLYEFIDKDVYQNPRIKHFDGTVTNAPTWYERTHSLSPKNKIFGYKIYDSYNQHGSRIYGKIYRNDYANINENYSDNNYFSHGNPLSDDISVESFLKLMNKENLKSNKSFNFPQVERDSFWEDFENWMTEEEGQNWKDIFTKEFDKARNRHKVKIDPIFH